MKIGLLEDNPAILDYLSTALEMAGHKVYGHIYGSSLLETLFASPRIPSLLPYDLVIIDLLLPGNISGLEAIQHIQQNLSRERLPIIVISAISQDELDQIKMGLPDVPFLRKPFKMRTLLQLIEEMKVSS